MKNNKIQKIVIAGGGTAGWLTAAALSKLLGKGFDITLIESDEIGTVGVGEAAIPTLVTFHRLLGIDEQVFMRATNATFKLGINFENWKQKNNDYMHGFGNIGKECWAGEFQHFWLHGLGKGIEVPFDKYCYEIQAAKANKFAKEQQGPLNYSYHLDATLYGKFLRSCSEKLGVKRLEGKIVSVAKHEDTGDIASLTLNSGQQIDGQIFVDCTGFIGLLIEKSLHTGYEDWSHWLPCDSAVAVQTKPTDSLPPYTRSIAHDSGWQWRIPLQSRVGNGLVYCSRYMSDDEAKYKLLENIDGDTINEPRVIKYRTGRRRKAWNKNCIAIGLSSGFVEPLESTNIHLIMSGILRLIKLFPFEGVNQSTIDEYNQQFNEEIEQVRDFIIMHYHVTERDDSSFWKYCKNMEIPASLQHRINLFKDTSRLSISPGELFHSDSWSQVMIGQGIMPKQYHQIANVMGKDEFTNFLRNIREPIKEKVKQLTSHQEFIDHYCKSEY
jgi:tryptophan halogenase